MRGVMRKALITTIMLFCVMFTAQARDLSAYRESLFVPRVAYLNPDNGAEIELGGRSSIVFSWKMVPIPAGGRDSYKFTLYKGDGYDVVASVVLGPETFSFDVPASKFEPGKRYRWQVKQRDARTMEWSAYDSWYFQVANSVP